ncbi:MAG: N-acetylmuramoyl-L-alanine amidase-like domain-containing protein [Ignavibacteria bacterium]
MSKLSRRNFIKTSAISAIFLTSLPGTLKSMTNSYFDDYDEVLCKKKFKFLVDGGVKSMSIGDAIGEVGKSFIDTDYVAGTLDKNMSESLVINLTGLDCVTFVENCLTFARCVKLGKTSFDDYKSELKKIRYRNGQLDGYASRLHYFCDWIYNNEDKGIVKNITADIGGVSYDKKIDFMTNHTKSYKQLSSSTELEGIKAAEEAINSRYYYYIPTSAISKSYDQMQTGDIIATTTSIGGLDVTHTGYVYKEGGGTYFMHASSKSKKVIISPEELQDYVASDSKKTGIMIARPFEV